MPTWALARRTSNMARALEKAGFASADEVRGMMIALDKEGYYITGNEPPRSDGHDAHLRKVGNDYFLNILKTYKDRTFPMLVPVIVDLADNHWHKILQESLIALKTILKEIDPYPYEEALKMSPAQRKPFAISQDEKERKQLDSRWD